MLFTTLLATYGLCFILLDSSLFSLPRDWLRRKSKFFNSLLSCYACSGFWCSLAVSLYSNSTILENYPYAAAHQGLIDALAGSAFCFALDTTLKALERSNTINVTNKTLQ